MAVERESERLVRELAELSDEIRKTRNDQRRVQMLRKMRQLLAAADRVLGPELDEQ